VEQFAAGLGVADPSPSLKGGTNYAWGGAETGTGLSVQNGISPNVNTQVATFLAGHTLGASQLVVLDGGANNFFDGKTDSNAPVDDLAAAITSLIAAGGKQFLVQNIPQLGEVPGSLSLPKAQRDALDQLSLSYDSLLHDRLAQLRSSFGVTIHEVDLDGLLKAVRADPAAYGLTNTTTSALGDGVTSGAGYLFWDSVHPTTAGHMIIADAALAAVVPEPSPLVLALAGLAAFGAAAAWRRRQGRAVVASRV
jgi:phospholipase/lecithinase/hemolysin